MSREHKVLDMFERANPVPDPDLVHVEPDASRYLADLLYDDPTVIRIEPADRQPLTDRRRWLLPAAVAAVAVLVVTGLVLVVRDNSTDQAPADTPPATDPDTDSDVPVTTAPSTVVEPPAGTLVTESGQTIASLVGDINWTRVDGDAANLPQEVLFEYEGQYVGVNGDGTSWRSDDARTWTEIDPLPGGDHAFVDFEGIWTILDSPDPGQSPRLGEWDGTSFRPVELPGPWPVVPSGLRVTGRSARIGTEAYELLVIESATYGLDPANDVIELGDDVDMSDVGITWVDDHTYRVTLTEDGAEQQIGPDLTLSADPSNPSIVQITAPEGIVGRIGPWPGLDAEQLISRLHIGDLSKHRALHIGNRATHFHTQAASHIDGEVLGLSSSLSTSFAVVSERDGSRLSLLVHGNRVDEIPMSEPGPIRHMTITDSHSYPSGSDRGAVLHLEIDPPLHAEDWFTDDGGRSWQPTNAPRYLGGVLAADFGWVKHSREELYTLEQLATTGYPFSVSAGGIDWDDISIDLDIDPVVDDQTPSVTVTVANDTIFVSVDDGENRTLWVGDVTAHDGG